MLQQAPCVRGTRAYDYRNGLVVLCVKLTTCSNSNAVCTAQGIQGLRTVGCCYCTCDSTVWLNTLTRTHIHTQTHTHTTHTHTHKHKYTYAQGMYNSAKCELHKTPKASACAYPLCRCLTQTSGSLWISRASSTCAWSSTRRSSGGEVTSKSSA